MSISKEIERLQQAKKDIGDAIVRKGGSVNGTIDTYAKSVMALGDVSFRTAIDIVNKSDAKNVDLTMISPKNETSLNKLFFKNEKLVSIDVSTWDTSKVTSAHHLFLACSAELIDLSGLDLRQVTNMHKAFYGNHKLSVIKCTGLKLPNIELSSIGLNDSPLTVDSIVGLLNALPQSDKGYSFQIGSGNIAKLSDEQKAIATTKGWTLI